MKELYTETNYFRLTGLIFKEFYGSTVRVGVWEYFFGDNFHKGEILDAFKTILFAVSIILFRTVFFIFSPIAIPLLAIVGTVHNKDHKKNLAKKKGDEGTYMVMKDD